MDACAPPLSRDPTDFWIIPPDSANRGNRQNLNSTVKANRIRGLLALFGMVATVASAQIPILQYTFNETGTAAGSTGSNPTALTLTNASGVAADLHSASALGVSGLPGDRAFDNTASTGMGGAGVGGTAFVNNYMSLPSQLDSFTFQCWYNTSSVPSQAARLFDDGRISAFAGSAGGWFNFDVNSEGVASPTVYTQTNQWVFFAVSYDSTQSSNNVVFYQGSQTSPVSIVSVATLNAGAASMASHPLGIGNYYASNIRPLQGLMDDVRVFGSVSDASGALSQAQLETIRRQDVAGSQYGTTAGLIGVQFVQAGPALASTQVAGIVPQDNYNVVNVNNSSGTNGTTPLLLNSNGSPTSVTLTHVSNDGYNSNTATSTPNGILLHGEDKTGPAGTTQSSKPGLTSTYTFNNVPPGTYNLIAYIENDYAGVSANMTVGPTTYYVIDESVTGTPPFTLANSTDPNNRATGNYVEFLNVSPVQGQITVTYTSEGGANDTASINGFQLQTVGTQTSPNVVTVTPVSTTTFDSTQVGNANTLAFTVMNQTAYPVTGSAAVSGVAGTSLPFTILQGGTYNLSPGQSQTVIVQFSPTAAGDYSGYVTFSDGSSWKVTASSYVDPMGTGGAITGSVTDATTGLPISGATVTAFVNADVVQLPSGPTALSYNSGIYTITNVPQASDYHVQAVANGYYGNDYLQSPVQVVAGQTTSRINIALTPLPPSQPTSLSAQDTPVVLVRGVGANQLWIPGTGDTWGDQTVDYNPAEPTVSQYLKFNGFTEIWDCNEPDDDAPYQQYPIFGGNGQVINGEEGIVTNSYNFEYYVQQKALQYKRNMGYYPPYINIVTHSMGGLIVRQALAGSSYVGFPDPSTGLPVQIKINKVIMLAPPNAGSEVADYFAPIGIISIENSFQLGTVNIFQPFWPSTQDLTTQHVRNQINKSWPSTAQLYTYAGSGGPTSKDAGLNFGSNIIVSHYVGFPGDTSFPSDASTNDGAVSQASVQGLYYPSDYRLISWFDPAPTSCFYASSVQNEIDTDPLLGGSSHVVDHYSVLDDLPTIQWVASCLTGITAAPNVSSALPAVEPSAFSTVAAGQATASSPSMQMLSHFDAEISSGSTTQFTVVSDAATTLKVQFLCSGRDAVFQLTDPAGASVTSSTPESNPNVQYTATTGTTGTTLIIFQITNPTLGIWTAIINGTVMAESQLGYDLAIFGDSYITVAPETASLFHQGQDVVVACAVVDTGTTPATPVENATVTARATLPDGTTSAISLYDDGLHNDGAPNDGTYANILPALSEAGDYTISYFVTGTNSQGEAFQRTATSQFSVSSEDASLLGDPIYQLINTNSNGLDNYAELQVWVNPAVSGTYIFSGQLVGPSGTNTFSDSEQFYSAGTGPMLVNLTFDLNQIRASGGVGYYQVSNLELFEIANNETAWLDTYQGSSGLQIGPNITSPPQSQASEEGTSATFSVTSDGGIGDTYQWQLNGVGIAGATQSSLNLSPVSIAQSGTYTVVVSNATGTATTAPVTLTVTPSTTFQLWQSARFTPAQLNDATVSGEMAMPAGDGIANLMKYALNLNPFGMGQAGLPIQGTINEGGSKYLTLSYTDVPARTDTTYTVQVSGDLKTWSSGSGFTSQVSATNNPDGVTETVVVQDLVPLVNGGTTRFMRLMVTDP
jgi:hypothetical protein